MGEVEVVFGFWSIIFLIFFAAIKGRSLAIAYLESLNFTEALFVFVIMCMAATRPVIYFVEKIIFFISKFLPFNERMSFYITALIIGPLIGSVITEPAAMTVTALVLLECLFKDSITLRLKYATIALLFVNISIGGTLTHFAAPPVLMVARAWHWDLRFMFTHFGYKSAIAIMISTFLITFIFKKELKGKIIEKTLPRNYLVPKYWKILIHLLFLVLVVMSSHHPMIFFGLFFLFLGFTKMTEKYQDKLKIKESFLVALFLAGLVCLGSMQSWWLNILLSKMNNLSLFFGTTALTSITDNAALTYLGSLVDLSDASKYSLVAGAVAGGGLTVIANAPNPAGFGILKESFGREGINPIKLFLWAILPTIIAILALLFLPNL